ncbi:MAG: hypothetical protein ACRC9K_13880 [Afipia sp.]
MDGIDHELQRWAKTLLDLFGIKILNETGRSLHVSEQDRDLFSLAFDRGAGFKQPFRQMPWRIDGRGDVLRAGLLRIKRSAATIRAALVAKSMRPRER